MQKRDTDWGRDRGGISCGAFIGLCIVGIVALCSLGSALI